MYINTFKYTPKDVSCQLCTEYVKKLGCTTLRCPWLAERIEAGVVDYREAVMETFPRDRRLSSRLNLLIKHYPGSLWSNEQHERRMQYQCAAQGYRRRRDTNAYYAAMYLLTSNDDIYRRTANCFCKDGIEFGYAVLKNTSPHNYALFMAARDLCDKTEAVTMADLAEPEVIDPEALRLIVNATLIARYGLSMAYVNVPKDLTKVKTKVLFNLTKRQLICFGSGALIGVPLFFLLKGSIGTSPAAMVMMVVMIPAMLFAMYEKNGQPLEVVIRNIYRVCFQRPKQRPYKTNNFYAVLERQNQLDREVYQIVRKEKADPRRTKTDRSRHRKSEPNG